MKCQNCGENEANFKYTQIINGIKKQMSLCDKCAKELGIDDINFNMPISFSSFLGDMFNLNDSDLISTFEKQDILTCNKCNMSYNEFLETGEVGCDNCYEVFKTKMDSILKNIHGASRHVGRTGKISKDKLDNKTNNNVNEKHQEDENAKRTKGEIDKELKEKNELERLKEKLQKEIEEERYEDAAKTRDEIKKIEEA